MFTTVKSARGRGGGFGRNKRRQERGQNFGGDFAGLGSVAAEGLRARPAVLKTGSPSEFDFRAEQTNYSIFILYEPLENEFSSWPDL